jgi:hypothetical protein
MVAVSSRGLSVAGLEFTEFGTDGWAQPGDDGGAWLTAAGVDVRAFPSNAETSHTPPCRGPYR